MLLARSQRVSQMRVAQRQQRSLLQFVNEERQPYAAEPDDSHWIEPVDCQTLTAELRRDQPEEVDHPHYESQTSDRRQRPRAPFQIAREQQQERQREMQHDQQHADPPPTALQSRRVKRDLLR